MAKTNSTGGRYSAAKTLVGILLTSTVLTAGSASAQSVAPAPVADEIVVEGIRATIQNSIEVKKRATEIVEALSASEIGDLPALSIGEAIETLTSAASHREQGGATEISLRGLGPFLGSTVVNGRVASNGSGDRSVNFSQFPSELFNKIEVYKTQSANMIGGGVAGQIALSTVRPIDYGKRRIQGEFKLNYNPQNFDIAKDQRLRDFGYRGTVSYVDQFKLGDGELGISLGYSRNVQTNPEQEANVSGTVNFCKNDPTDTSSGVFDDGNCNSTYNPAQKFVIAGNSYTYRQNITDDTRDSFFGALQMKPNSDVNINMDFQYSKRKFEERRNDLVFAEGRRIDGVGDINHLNYDLITGPNGELYQFTSEQRVETYSEYLTRDEEYYGGGLSAEVQATDRLKISGDVSYSETKRVEVGAQIRFQSEARDIFGNTVTWTPGIESDGTVRTDRPETATLIRRNGSDIFNFVLQDFDVTNYNLFADQARGRYDLEQNRFNSVFAFRGDIEYDFQGDFLTTLETGFRFQELKYKDVPGAANGSSRFEKTYSDSALSLANQACRTSFPEKNFLSSVSNGNPLFTVVNSAGAVVSKGNTFATFDALCVLQTLEKNDPSGRVTFDKDGIPSFPNGNFDSIQNNDVNEKTWAGYIQANFDGDLGSLPVRGNLGLRVLNTKVNSKGFRGTLTSSFNVDGELQITENQGSLTTVSGGGEYTKFLPSFNLTAEVQPDVFARFAVFRALSRPDPSALGYGRSFSALLDDEVTSIAEAVGTATASGNPFTKPLMSWNFDGALEWYPNKDTILAGGVYYKKFNGGFVNTSQNEVFIVDGAPLNTIVTTQNTDGKTSNIFGFEISAAHRFSYLPAPLDGLGFKVGYNYAQSNFEFEDDVLGSTNQVAADGTITKRIGVIPPAEIFGLSKHVLSAQLYYQLGGFDFQGVYKYRSRYFQQFISSPGRIRYVDDTGVFEARLSYKINNNIRFTLEGLNLFNEPRTDLRGTVDNFASQSVYGPRYFAGVKMKF